MKFLRKMCSILLILAWEICGSIEVSLTDEAESPVFIDTEQNEDWVLRLKAGYAFGQFIGLNDSYAELGLFLAPKTLGKWLPFADINGYLLNNGEWATSAGLGLRWLNVDSQRIWGANFYYDGRKSHRKTVFNRLGIGLESLGPIDFRINGYFPLNQSRQCSVCSFKNSNGDFFWKQTQKEFTFRGVDAELGAYLLEWRDFSFYGAAGPYYYYNRSVNGFVGGFARLELNWREYLSFNMRLSYDKKYQTKVQGEILLTLPLYELFVNHSFESYKEIFTQPVQRNNLIFTDHSRHTTWNWKD
jgi:Inverse autotransporter, beta-domain